MALRSKTAPSPYEDVSTDMIMLSWGSNKVRSGLADSINLIESSLLPPIGYPSQAGCVAIVL